MNNIEEQAKELLNKISSKVEEVTAVAPSRVSKSDKLKRWSAFIRVESPREEFLWSVGYPDDHGVSAIRIGTWVSQPSSDQQEVYDALESMLTNQFPEHTVDRNEKGIALEIKLNMKADSQKLDENLLKITHNIQSLIPTFYELIDGKIVFNRGSGDGRESIINETNDLTPEQSNFLEEGFWSGDLEDEEKVPKAWLKNKSFMLQVVTSSGRALEYASDEIKSDRGIVLAAVKSDGSALEYASYDLKSDRGIVLAAVTSYGRALEYASDELKSEKEIVLAAVTSDGENLQYASDELKSDRGIVLAAVKSDGRALEYASYDLKSDREIVLEAVKSSEYNIMYASASFLNEYYNESSLYDWNYENQDSEQGFFEWLNNFEMPDEEIDYVLTYRRIYEDVDKLFRKYKKFFENLESTYTDIIELNKSLLEEGAIEVYDKLDADSKEFCIEEAYEDDPLGAIMNCGNEFGGEGGSISSPDFIKHFTSLEDQRNVLGLNVASLVKFLWLDMGNDWDSAPSYWEGYQIKKDDW